jgi:hypothetical protein
MKKVSDTDITSEGFTIIEGLFFLFALAIIVIIGVLLFSNHKNSKSSSSGRTATSTSFKTSPTNPYAVLAPATLPSKQTECSEPISYSTSGSPSPIQCANGDLNVTAWNALSALEPTVMSLGYTPSVSEVQSAICKDANAADADSSATTSNAIETSVYQISKIYYSWNFPSDPSVVLTNGTC